MRLWIIGKHGQLALALASLLQENAVFTSQQECDVTHKADVEKTFLEIEPTHIINCSGYTQVDRAEQEPERAFLLNGNALSNLATLPAKLIHISTDFVFDGKREGYSEIDTPNPINIYGKSKLLGEEIVQHYAQDPLIIRTSWVFSLHGKSFLRTILQLIKEKSHIQIVDDQWGRPTSAHFLAKTLLELISLNQKGIFHVACSGVTNWFGFAQQICSQVGASTIIEPVSHQIWNAKAPRPEKSILLTHKLEGILSEKPPMWQTSLSEILKR